MIEKSSWNDIFTSKVLPLISENMCFFIWTREKVLKNNKNSEKTQGKSRHKITVNPAVVLIIFCKKLFTLKDNNFLLLNNEIMHLLNFLFCIFLSVKYYSDFNSSLLPILTVQFSYIAQSFFNTFRFHLCIERYFICSKISFTNSAIYFEQFIDQTLSISVFLQ